MKTIQETDFSNYCNKVHVVANLPKLLFENFLSCYSIGYGSDKKKVNASTELNEAIIPKSNLSDIDYTTIRLNKC